MLKLIIFNEQGISTSVQTGGGLILTDNDIYDVEKSNSGFYKKDEGGNITAMSKEGLAEYNDSFVGYRSKRQREYPNVGDQLDAILEYLDAAGVPANSKVEGIINDWRAVKAKYPKS